MVTKLGLRKALGALRSGALITLVTGVAPAAVGAQQPATPAVAAIPAQEPTATYWVYVGAESADKIHRLRFGPGGFVVEKTVEIGELAAEMEGPHGLVISRDGKFLYMTTGHGFPDGKWWKYELPADTLVGPGILLGNFPASIDVTPDGLYTMSANFNLHGDMVPSSVSVVYTPTATEVGHIVTCTMPHGSRFEPGGRYGYSGCMMDDQLVETDVRAMKVTRRFSVAKDREGPLPPDGGPALMLGMWIEGARKVSNGQTSDPAQVGYAAMGGTRHQMAPQTCSPTWTQPSADGRSVFVACNKSDEIVEVDRDSWTLRRKIKTGRGPYNIAVTPDGKLLLATLKPAASFEVYDLATGKILATLRNSTTVAHGVAVSPDSRYAFVSSEGVGAQPGKVDVYDLRALAKVGTVDVGQQASGIAFWRQQP
jgi:DNA-binding beta-propeller fold protein YncE